MSYGLVIILLLEQFCSVLRWFLTPQPLDNLNTHRPFVYNSNESGFLNSDGQGLKMSKSAPGQNQAC